MAKRPAKKIAPSVRALRVCTTKEPARTQILSEIGVPEPSLDHLKRLTDDTGLFQHAAGIIPNREHGYCTDDNARAVIAMARYYAQYGDPEALRLLDTYLSFIMHAQNSDGSFRNLMSFDRTWFDNDSPGDSLGRALWAFATVVAAPPSPPYLSTAQAYFDRSVWLVQKQFPRGLAYSILAIHAYLKQFPTATDIKRQLQFAADALVTLYENNALPDWQWFEGALTYDNAVLPHALFVAGMVLPNARYVEVAEKTCTFLLENTFNGRHFSFVGSKGWHKRGQTRATFDQQPIEAASTVMMLKAAYDVTKNDKFLTPQRKAFDWFLGANDLRTPLYDFATKGCNDALMPDGVNNNQGAESTLCFILSLLTITETQARKTSPSIR